MDLFIYIMLAAIFTVNILLAIRLYLCIHRSRAAQLASVVELSQELNHSLAALTVDSLQVLALASKLGLLVQAHYPWIDLKDYSRAVGDYRASASQDAQRRLLIAGVMLHKALAQVK